MERIANGRPRAIRTAIPTEARTCSASVDYRSINDLPLAAEDWPKSSGQVHPMRMPRKLRAISIGILALLFIAAGINHFVSPGAYLKIMPGFLPWPLALVYVSGFFEVAGGISIAVPRLRRAAGWGLIALLVAVFPANVHMAIHADDFPSIPFWILLARLPLQGALIAWVWWAAVRSSDAPNDSLRDLHRPV